VDHLAATSLGFSPSTFLDRLRTIRSFAMLRWALTFAIIAIIASGLGFYGLAGMSADIAKLFALVFLVLFVVALVAGQRMLGGPTV